MKGFQASHAVTQYAWPVTALSLATFMARRGLRKGSLNYSGALAAFFVGTVHMCCGLQYGLTLIFFYMSSSKLTRFGSKRKLQLQDGHSDGGRRDANQVLANSLAACIFAQLSYMILQSDGPPSPAQLRLAGAFLGHYACCCGDTWASELGILSTAPPRLITSGRKVPPGTNGGVSRLGLACSGAGGLAVGLAFYFAGTLGCAASGMPRGGTVCSSLARVEGHAWSHAGSLWGAGPADLPTLAMIGLLCGLFGSLLDSLLGATLQYTGWDTRAGRVVEKPPKGARGCEKDGDVTHISGLPVLSNSAVNFLSAAASAALGASLLSRWSVGV